MKHSTQHSIWMVQIKDGLGGHKAKRSRNGAGAELTEICILRLIDPLTQFIAFEKGKKNGFLAPLMTSLNDILVPSSR